MGDLNRREFMTAAGGVAVGGILGASAARAGQDDKIKIGLIGCGWYGMVDVKAAFKVGGVEVVALCDVDSKHLADSAAEVEKLQGSRPRTFKDYRYLLDVDGLEVVIIGTPPQWHALQFIAAVEKGLDVYCEKPLAYDIRECQAMVAAAKRSGRVVQIGFQRRQSAAMQEVKKFIAEGGIGKVVEAQAQIHYTAGMMDATVKAPPETLDWDMWCGPGPKIPYSEQVGHKSWRLEKTSGHGHLVDWGIHLIDASRVILGEEMPKWVSAAGGIYRFKDHITTPDVMSVQFEFERCPLFWRHRLWGATEYTPEVSNGIFFYGDKGTVFVTDRWWEFVPAGRNAERQKHEAGSDMGTLHMAEFLNAVRQRKQPGCLIEDAAKSTTAVKLAMISYDIGRKVEWDDEAKEIRGRRGRDLMKREYRAPYKHPYVG